MKSIKEIFSPNESSPLLYSELRKLLSYSLTERSNLLESNNFKLVNPATQFTNYCFERKRDGLYLDNVIYPEHFISQQIAKRHYSESGLEYEGSIDFIGYGYTESTTSEKPFIDFIIEEIRQTGSFLSTQNHQVLIDAANKIKIDLLKKCIKGLRVLTYDGVMIGEQGHCSRVYAFENYTLIYSYIDFETTPLRHCLIVLYKSN